ncbi:MAG: hypothetical protein CMJ34_08150 [Phycisphaerae bacterium]|nr:hypothetical protein [Phycisphaerae bacterium]
MESSHQPRSEPPALPAIATVMATALLLSVAMAGGAVPGLGSVGAVQAVLRSAGTTSLSSMSAPSSAMGLEADPDRGWGPSASMATTHAHDRFLASAPSGPGHADLPPPGA